MKYILGVTNCRHNEHLAQHQYETYLQDIHLFPIKYIRYIGDPSIKEDYIYDQSNSVMTLRCDDGYLNLSRKLYMFYKTVRILFPQVKGVFKIDDDVIINLQHLHNLLEDNSHLDYFGRLVDGKPYKSSYLQNKPYVYNQYPIFETATVDVKYGSYCAGGGYWVSNNAIDAILQAKYLFKPFKPDTYMDLYDESTNTFKGLYVFDDKNVGVVLNNAGIPPTHVNIRDAISWKGI